MILLGGAPELCSQFRFVASSAANLGKTVIDRCNLTALLEPGWCLYIWYQCKKTCYKSHVIHWFTSKMRHESTSISIAQHSSYHKIHLLLRHHFHQARRTPSPSWPPTASRSWPPSHATRQRMLICRGERESLPKASKHSSGASRNLLSSFVLFLGEHWS